MLLVCLKDNYLELSPLVVLTACSTLWYTTLLQKQLAAEKQRCSTVVLDWNNARQMIRNCYNYTTMTTTVMIVYSNCFFICVNHASVSNLSCAVFVVLLTLFLKACYLIYTGKASASVFNFLWMNIWTVSFTSIQTRYTEIPPQICFCHIFWACCCGTGRFLSLIKNVKKSVPLVFSRSLGGVFRRGQLQ